MIRMSQGGMLVLLLQLAGCGLGTEVGNGAKPKDTESESKKDASAPDDDAKSSAAPDAQEDGEQGEVSGGTDGATSDSDEISVPDGFDINPKLLAASCASPFAEDYGSNYLLQTADAGEGIRNVLHASRTGTAPWLVKDDKGDLLYNVAKDASSGALAVKTTDVDGNPLDFGYTCTSVTTKTNIDIDDHDGKVTSKSVYITDDQLKAKVTWFFTPAHDAVKAELVRVEIDDVDGEDDPVRLDVTTEAVP